MTIIMANLENNNNKLTALPSTDRVGGNTVGRLPTLPSVKPTPPTARPHRRPAEGDPLH